MRYNLERVHELMKARLILGWLLVLSLVTAIGYAQQPPARQLSLVEALGIARANNPDYLATLNNRWAARAEVLSSTALLFPTASIQGSSYSSQAGDGFVGSFPYHSGSTYRLGWNFGVNYQLSGAVITARWLLRAQARATDADIDGARSTLETSVRQQYLNVLQAQAQVTLAQHVLERANETLNLARARNTVGQGTLIDVRRAEVDKGTAEVGLLRANQAVENQLLGLFQWLGVPAPQPVAVVLTDTFPVTAPALDQDSLVRLALRENPNLVALHARESAATWQVRSAYSQYLPSLFASAGYGKYRMDQGVQPRDSLGNPVGPELRQITKGISPWSLQIGVQLPLYDGFQRNVSTAQARAAQDDLRQNIRRGELYIRAGVTAAYLALVAAYQTIGIQQTSQSASGEALSLATERYRVGNGTFLELLDARVTAEQADAAYVGAVYDYHKAFAALENAVGRPLR
jgi:outer membrane protein